MKRQDWKDVEKEKYYCSGCDIDFENKCNVTNTDLEFYECKDCYEDYNKQLEERYRYNT